MMSERKSDRYWEARAARRNRILLLVAGPIILMMLLYFIGRNAFYDRCTDSNDRSPQSVVESYVEAALRGDTEVAARCWKASAFYELLDAGCSEVCLLGFYGTQFDVDKIALNDPIETDEGRANIRATVSGRCTDGGQTHVGELLLDSVSSALPWKHWKIIHSTFGGEKVRNVWCE